MTDVVNKDNAGFGEFIALMAFIMCLVALSTDTILPALPEMRHDLAVADVNDIQLTISVLFIGVATGQLIYGPMADVKGRRPTIFLGFFLFVIGSLVCYFSTSLEVMLVGRFLQGLGAAGPRIVTLAIVRDKYQGREMARVLSLIMTIFILCPIIAPLLGQGVLMVAGWREIFALLLLLAVVAWLWFGFRQPETLLPEQRTAFSYKAMSGSVKEVFQHRTSLCYITGLGFIFGSFIGFLNSVQQVLQELYALGEAFPFYFAVLAAGLGLSSFINSKLVMRFGMRRLALSTLCYVAFISAVAVWVSLLAEGVPALWVIMLYFVQILFCMGLVFGNLNALSMEPFGHIAGMASGVVGALSTLIAVGVGTLVGQAFNDTVIPLITGFGVLGALSAIMTYMARTPQS
ncbi:MAG: multidrug effflux MFS transporter [Pontibacterium sp.]